MKKKILTWLSLASMLSAGTLLADSRIVGGVEATPGSWPWIVELSHLPDNYKGQFCAGSLIRADWVITASHCVYGENTDSFHIVAGVHNLKEDKGQQVKIKRIIMHPKYNNFTKDFDVALLQLKTPVKNAVTLPMIPGNTDLAGAMSTVIGWGNMSNNQYDFFPFKLQEVQLPIVSNQECRDLFEQKGQGPEAITNNMMCAGYFSGGKDSCQGDSGGPLMVQRFGKWVLAGIVSWGDGCALPLNYGVYSRVSRFVGFINEKIGLNYAGLADANHDGTINATDKQAKQDELQAVMKDYVEQCWTPEADCGDLNGDKLVDWRDLVKQSTNMDRDFKQWLEVIWTPETN
ncbi:MAG: serine protease [Methylovulum sp.]|nr:MAG: serine protease [Methylovulum sp.]